MKDAGTQKERLGADNMRSFEHCWLCLRPALKPVCTPGGYLFCKDCIVLNLAKQKKDYEEQKLLWDRQVLKDDKEMQEKIMEPTFKEITKFLEAEGRIKSDVPAPKESWSQQIANRTKFVERDKAAFVEKDFWIPQTATVAPQPTVIQPKRQCVCPISNTPLRLKELIEVKPETVTSDTETTKWVCAISKKPITHQKSAVVKSTGEVMLMECIEKYVFGKKGFYSDRDVSMNDIVKLIPGGTAFSLHNKVEAETFRPVME